MANLDALLRQLNEAPQVNQHWMELAAALLNAGNIDGLRSLFGHRHTLKMSAMDFAVDVFNLMAAHREHLLAITEAYPSDCPFSVAALIARACANAREFQLDSCVHEMREANRRFSIVARSIPEMRLRDATLYWLACAVTLFEPSNWRPRLLHAAPRPDFGGQQAPAGPELACVAFADSVYTCLYALEFAKGIRAISGPAALPVVGVLNPTPDALAVMAQIRQEVPGAVIFPVLYDGDKLPEMAASARFVVANEVLDFLARPTVFLDIDTRFGPETGDVLRGIAGFPLSVQKLGALPPYLIIDACAVGTHPGPNSTRFFGITREYILGKLAEPGPLWTIDQVALHRAVCLARTEVTDLCTAFDGRWKFPAILKREHAVGLTSRAATRTNHNYRDYSILADGTVRWSLRA